MQRHRAETVLDVYADLECDRLLDVGCGYGEFTSRIGDACGASEIHGIDVAEDRVRGAADNGVAAARVDVDAAGLPFRSGSFDSIHAGECVDYFDDPGAFFGEARRCLTADGTLVVSTPNLGSLHNRLALVAGRDPFPARATADTLVESRSDRVLSRRRSVFTLRSLSLALRRQGFEVLDVRGSHSGAADGSCVVEAAESILETVPALSYRLIAVCRPAGSR